MSKTATGSGDMRTRIIEWRCVNCGVKFDEDRQTVPLESKHKDCVIQIIRCPECTRRGVKLLGKRVARRAEQVEAPNT